MKPDERDTLTRRSVLAAEELARAARTLADRARTPLPTIGRPPTFQPTSLFVDTVPAEYIVRACVVATRAETLAVLCICGARTEMPEKGWCACDGACGRRFMPHRSGPWWQEGPKAIRVHRFPSDADLPPDE